MTQDDLLRFTVAALERLGLPYMVVGSMASMLFGEPRLTLDIDVVVRMAMGDVERFLTCFPESDFYISPEAMRDAIRHRSQFNVIHPASGMKVDFMIAHAHAHDRLRFARVRREQAGENFQANYASPEDVIIKKLEFYKEGGSEKHLRDITGILKIQGAAIDRQYIRQWAVRLDVVSNWETILKKLGP